MNRRKKRAAPPAETYDKGEQNGEDITGGSSRPLRPNKTKREDHSQGGNPATGNKPTHHSNTQAEGATQGGRTGHPTGRTIQKTKGGPPTPPGPRGKYRDKAGPKRKD